MTNSLMTFILLQTTLLLAANVPSAKKVVVHGTDASGIPTQFPVLEVSQFLQLLFRKAEVEKL